MQKPYQRIHKAKLKTNMESTNIDLCLVRITCYYFCPNYVYKTCDNVISHFIKESLLLEIYGVWFSDYLIIQTLKNGILYVL